MTQKDCVLIIKRLIIGINYALLAFYLSHFKRYESIERFNSVWLNHINIRKNIVKHVIVINLSLEELQKLEELRATKECLKIYCKACLMNQSKQKKTKTVGDTRKGNSDSDKILRDIRILFEPEEDYYEPVKTINAFNNNYTEYESNGDKDKH